MDSDSAVALGAESDSGGTSNDGKQDRKVEVKCIQVCSIICLAHIAASMYLGNACTICWE